MDDWITKLKFSLLSIQTIGDIRQPWNHFMDCLPSGYSRWQIAYRYFCDIERILQEMKASISFVSAPPEDDFLKKHNVQSEDYVLYHQGYFLDLVHQLKDKLCQLVKSTTVVGGDYSEKQQKKLTLNKLLKDTFVSRIPNLKECLNDWDDNNSNGVIAQALKKRTHYHHYNNPLTEIDSYSNVRSNRMFLTDNFKDLLSEAGKDMITKRIDTSYQIWQSDAVKKMKEIFDSVDSSIQAISKSLVVYFKFPQKNSRKIRKVMIRFVNLYDYYSIPRSNYTISSMDTIFQTAILFLKDKLERILGEELSAFYVTGSILRKEYIHDFSDVNFVLVLKSNNQDIINFINEYFHSEVMAGGIIVDLVIVSKINFYEKNFEKLRFICQTDGLLVTGEDLLREEKNKVASFKVSWLLNSDFKDFVHNIKGKLQDQNCIYLEKVEICKIIRDIAKHAFRLNFSMVTGNNLRYVSDFKNMRELSNFYYPENKKMCTYLYGILAGYLIGDREVALEMVKICEEKLMPLYNKMEELAGKSLSTNEIE